MNRGLLGLPLARRHGAMNLRGFPLGRMKPDFMSNDSVSIGLGTGATYGTVVTAGASANLKGSWVALSDAIPFDAYGLELHFQQANSVVKRFLFDLGIGSAGQEQVLVADFPATSDTGGRFVEKLFVPLFIPAGTRVVMRCQSQTAGVTTTLHGRILSGDFMPPRLLRTCTTYGSNLADTSATAYDPGTTVNTFGPWTEIVAATVDSIEHLVVCITQNGDTQQDNTDYELRVGVGGGTTPDRTLLEGIWFRSTTTWDIWRPCFHGFDVYIPAGSRITVSGRCNTTTVDRLIDVALLGFS